jgi:hypothetical protein
MTEPHSDQPGAPEGLAHVRAGAEAPHDHHVASLRGASAASVGRRFWLVAGTLGLIAFTVALAVGFLSINPIDCIGNVGGSGSNGAGYTCRGQYRVGASTYRELIGSMTTFSASGTTVRAVADPAHHASVVLASAVKASSASPGSYVVPGLLAIVLVALALALRRVARRTPSPGRPAGSS